MPQDSGGWTAGILVVLSATLLVRSFPSSFAYDRPIHTVIYGFVLAAACLLTLAKIYPNLFRQHASHEVYSALEMDETEETDLYDRPLEKIQAPSVTRQPLSQSSIRSLIVLSVCALALRVDVFRRVSAATECTTSSLEIFVPLIVAIHDALRFESKIFTTREDSPDASIYESVYSTFRFYLRSYQWRYIPSVFTFCLGAYLTRHLWTGLASTYICPTGTGQDRVVPLLQVGAMLLDGFLACVFVELCLPGASSWQGIHGHVTSTLAYILLATSLFWTIVAAVVFYLQPELRGWLLILSGSFRTKWLFAATWQSLLFTVLFISLTSCTLQSSPVGLTLLLASVFVLIPALTMLWNSWLPYPPIPARGSVFSFLLIYIAWTSYGRIAQSVTSRSRTSFSRHLVYFFSFLILILPGLWRTNKIAFHPIDLLIYEARVEHLKYARYQTDSHNLETAVLQYRRRYGISPPPSFDKWYQYAKDRSSLIIDSYDQMHEDLLPWNAIPPAEIRRLTWELVSNPWNEVSGITIRNGIPEIMSNVLADHRWMLEGIAKMIEPFAEHLPDMDLAFNINDEPRVAVPYSEIQRLKSEGLKKEQTASLTKESWSSNRSSTWLPVSEESTPETRLENLSFRQTFYKYGSVGCPPKSLANEKLLNSRSQLCLECVTPHSIGQYVSNWTHAADVCHQPDLAYLHGLYLSPAAFKASNNMQPIFSQSKPHGYNDILYPSPWNYLDKAVYAPYDAVGQPGDTDYSPGHPDPEFSQKKNVLFWRGATSEGVAEGTGRATWRGMGRQRLVHLANNLTSSMAVFLPSTHKDKYEYRLVNGEDAKALGLQTDIAIVDRIARCGGVDCDDQEQEFTLVAPSDFQDHWQYRYLFDLDGAGFSGRFLPFLHSRSLPFKSALFREWYDERLTAWRHFVPQDLRLQNLYSSLAYFAGVNGTWHGKKVFMAPHAREGELIAEEGREWAGKVLRKDDMEVYLFRLLLEWGRLTDDNRDELGYAYSSGGSGRGGS